MIWRRKRRRPSRETVKTQQQLERAREDLAAAIADGETVDRVAEQVERIYLRNHFGPMITELIRKHAQ